MRLRSSGLVVVLGLLLMTASSLLAFSPPYSGGQTNAAHPQVPLTLPMQMFSAKQVPGMQKAGAPAWFPAFSASSSGTINVLVVLMDFNDSIISSDRTDSAAYWEDLMFGDDAEGEGPYPFQSLRQFYAEQSHGALDIQGEVLGWKQATSSSTYYAKKNGDDDDACHGLATNQVNQGSLSCVSGSGLNCITQGGSFVLVEEALNAANNDPEIDLDRYDNDGDGTLDGIIVIHAGANAELSSACNDLWSHQYVGEFNIGGETQKSLYVVAPERFYCRDVFCGPGRDGDVVPAGIGVAAHEFGHVLGLPDLYAQEGNGVGHYSWMGWGIYGDASQTPEDWGSDVFPGGVDPWSCNALGWCTPDTISENQCSYPIRPLTTGTEVARINLDEAGNEYYLISFLAPKGPWRLIGGNGISIYHADDLKGSPNLRINTQPCIQDEESCDFKHYWVAYEQKDGRYELEKGINRGNTSDLWQLFDTFHPAEPPTSCSYSAEQCNISVSVRSLLSDNATLRIIVDPDDLPPKPQLLAIPTGDELVATVGRLYEYQPQLLSGQSPDLRWHLITAPQGMEIDERTGKITWTPTAEQDGSFDVRLLIDNCAGEFTQTWKVAVRQGGGGCSVGGGAMAGEWILFIVMLLGYYETRKTKRKRYATRYSDRKSLQNVSLRADQD